MSSVQPDKVPTLVVPISNSGQAHSIGKAWKWCRGTVSDVLGYLINCISALFSYMLSNFKRNSDNVKEESEIVQVQPAFMIYLRKMAENKRSFGTSSDPCPEQIAAQIIAQIKGYKDIPWQQLHDVFVHQLGYESLGGCVVLCTLPTTEEVVNLLLDAGLNEDEIVDGIKPIRLNHQMKNEELKAYIHSKKNLQIS